MCRPDALIHLRRKCSKVQLLEKAVFGDMFAEHHNNNNKSPPQPISYPHPGAPISSNNHHHPLHDNSVVHHHYTDHAHDPPPTHVDLTELKKRNSSTATFPIRLHNLLNQMDTDGLANVLSWQPHGRCFGIHRPKDFKLLLPQYFHGVSKVASFQRQLNLYGFQRITQGPDKGCYYHELFLRDRIYLAYKIQRFKIKGTGVRGKANPDEEPDFYAMEWVGLDHHSSRGQEEERGKRKIATTSNVANADMANIVESLEPTPISCSSIAALNAGRATDDEPCVLAEFGRTFFALDSVSSSSDDNDSEPIPVAAPPQIPLSSSTATTRATSSSPSWNDLCDPLYLDRALNDMFLRDGQQPLGGDMDRLLQIVLQ